MKKRYLFLLTPAILLSLVGCKPKPTDSTGGGTSVPPTSNPAPSTSVPVPPSSIVPPPSTPDPGPEYVIPTDLKEMHDAVANAAKDEYVGFIATVVGLQKYAGSSNVNVYLQNGKYGYRINNIPADLVEMGKTYEVYGGGAAKTYPAINYSSNGSIKASTATVDATPLTWSKDIAITDSCGASVTGTGRITAINATAANPTIDVKIGEETVILSYVKNTDAGEDLTAKWADATIGQEITFTGCFYDAKEGYVKNVSILDATKVILGEVEKVALPGTVTKHETIGGPDLTIDTATANEVTFKGTVAWTSEDPGHRFSEGNIVGVKITKNAAVTKLDDLRVCTEGYGTSGATWIGKAELEAQGLLLQDGFELFINIDDLIGGPKSIVIQWTSYALDQTITFKADGSIQKENKPAEALYGRVTGDPNSDLGGAPTGSIDADHPLTIVTDNRTTMTFGGTGEQIAYYQADEALGRTEGNRVGLQIDAPVDFVANDVKVNIFKGAVKTHTDLTWADVKESGGDYFWFYPLVTDVTDVYTVKINWKAGTADQVITIAIAEGTTLQANPNASAVIDDTLTTVSGTTLPSGWSSDGLNGTKLGYGSDPKAYRFGKSNNDCFMQFDLTGKSIASTKVTVTFSVAKTVDESGKVNVEIGNGTDKVQGIEQSVVKNTATNSSIHFGADKESTYVTFEIDIASVSAPTYVKIFTNYTSGQMTICNVVISA